MCRRGYARLRGPRGAQQVRKGLDCGETLLRDSTVLQYPTERVWPSHCIGREDFSTYPAGRLICAVDCEMMGL
jgi:hypothetical protein